MKRIKRNPETDLLAIIDGPVYHNHCCHSDEDYVCSFEVDGNKFDLYVYDGMLGQSVCIRCSDEGSDYLSPGPVINLFLFRSEPYQMVWRILNTYGTFSWSPKPL